MEFMPVQPNLDKSEKRSVKNNAKAINTWFGGVCCVPSACLNMDITITILVKEVIPNNNEGRIVKADINNNICKEREYVVPPLSLVCTFNAGSPPKSSCDWRSLKKNMAKNNITKENNNFILFDKIIIIASH